MKPVAWMYEHEGMVHDGFNPPVFSIIQRGATEPWNETPLFTAGQLRQVEQQRDELAAACQWYSDNPDSPISALEHIRAALAKVNAIRKIAALQADLDEWKAACEQKHELLGPTKQDLQECQRQVLALEQERDALKADAERYRWLRDSEDSPLYYKPAGYGV